MGAGVSLPMGRKGSRFAVMNAGCGSRRAGERLMFGTRCSSLNSPEDVMVMEADASVDSEKEDSQVAMISVLRLST